MRTVYHAENLIDAHLVKDALESVGIPAFIAGEYLTGGVGQLPARDFIAVMVPDGLVDAATPQVAALEHALAESRQALRDDEGGADSGLIPA
ncbi:MAG TPA: DUF2007 domain-containing protein [Rhodanobacteraceae bacterium]|nr:DUF2007 domain-containing protein [Rhodanobacteraceae bacterium]